MESGKGQCYCLETGGPACSDKLQKSPLARALLFVKFPGIVPAIQRGGAFGGSFLRAIATDIFKASEEGIADARRLSRIEAVAPHT